ncbi:MAG: DNA polymerase/3'-5' exonuclease PolX [Undibacterium sp.]|uniref:DNA polymerase/3'-5' exonuclease PolX n=1 Tax=Undibacterium sp. TaxID=1914977 RepID=UPI00272530FF|nr:DNA polymerase/3'-5' exonuclease PolX [Undibacterium sp.]MDO8653945.1 DNA polymerase/3'-5' exonuclease PolX [Undibacterium sp.]
MPVHNADIAAIFNDIADLLEISDANPFRIRAYRNAARTVSGFSHEFKTLIDTGTALPKLPGIGTDLSAKIHEIVTTGHCTLLDTLHQQVPPVMTELLKVAGLGTKRVQALHSELGISTIAQLKQAARTGKIRTVAGFGPKSEQRILDSLAALVEPDNRFKRPIAMQYAQTLVDYLKRVDGVNQVVVAGSYRRMQDTVGDLDILVTTSADTRVMERFLAYDEVRTVLAHGATRSSVVLKSGLQVDLRMVKTENYGAALHYFTGSKAHNISIRRLARARGLKINEYGVFRGTQRIAGETEESVFAAVDLPLIPPELREDRGEIESGRNGTLPRLITLTDLRGDLHVHTNASDGKNTLEEMVQAAQAQGLQYMAITDHSRRLTVTHGLDVHQLARQIDEIDRMNTANAQVSDFIILKGSEVDILEDGTLDLPDSILQRLDIVIVAIHSQLSLPRERQTERLLRAMDNPYVNLLAHPTGRLMGVRGPSEINLPDIMRKAKERHICLELNSQPDRLDLNDTLCKMARDEGVMISINSDAHSSFDFANLQYGIGQARRGWLASENVLNTGSIEMVRKFLQSKRAH